MSRAVARLNDNCTGHGGYASRPCTQASQDVFFNGRGAHRQGDKWAIHTGRASHDGTLASGSPTVFTNSKQQGRVMDPVTCGSYVATGSPDIFIE